MGNPGNIGCVTGIIMGEQLHVEYSFYYRGEKNEDEEVFPLSALNDDFDMSAYVLQKKEKLIEEELLKKDQREKENRLDQRAKELYQQALAQATAELASI